jgi:hypothetical protein
MAVGFGRGIKSKGTPLSVMANLKSSIVEVRAEKNCSAHTLTIAIAKLTDDPSYNSYRRDPFNYQTFHRGFISV